jgi:hypothetical protein
MTWNRRRSEPHSSGGSTTSIETPASRRSGAWRRDTTYRVIVAAFRRHLRELLRGTEAQT